MEGLGRAPGKESDLESNSALLLFLAVTARPSQRVPVSPDPLCSQLPRGYRLKEGAQGRTHPLARGPTDPDTALDMYVAIIHTTTAT